MSSSFRTRVRHASCLIVLASVYVLQFGSHGIAASSATSSAVGIINLDDSCEEECGPSASCEQGCWSYPPQLPGFHTTCGNYGGEPWNGTGMCLGECGDSFCNEYNEEDGESCYEDCGECGDDVCEGPEDLENCALDCHSCGDGYCTPFETCTNCGTDCNPTSATCAGDLPGTPDGCDEGEVQNSAGYCCEVEDLVEGLDGCLSCGPTEQCMLIFFAVIPSPYHAQSILGWGCVKKGASCDGSN